MKNFSERHGFAQPLPLYQKELTNGDRVRLWNVLNVRIWRLWSREDFAYLTPEVEAVEQLAHTIWTDFLHWDLDEKPYEFRGPASSAYTRFKQSFLNAAWPFCFDFIEFVLKVQRLTSPKDLVTDLNHVLSTSNSVYRFIDNLAVEIADPLQGKAIQKVLDGETDAAQMHIKKALKLLSEHEHPDYPNVVKEAISAVGVICRTAGDASSLGEAIKKLAISPRLKAAFEKMYAWTNSTGGSRHENMDNSTISAAEARYTVVACSAFITYLRETLPPERLKKG